MTNQCIYIYGIVDHDFCLPGDYHELRLAHVGRVAAVHSVAQVDEFADLSDDLSEAGRLAVLARRHDQTLQSLAAAGPVLPARLGTLFPDVETMAKLVAAAQGSLAAELDRVRGRAEWAVRIEARPESPDVEATGSGTAYLQRRREARRHEAELRDVLGAAMSSVDATLAGFADRVAGSGVSHGGTSMSRSYLVHAGNRGPFVAAAAEAAAELETRGGTLTVFGPLPPYSFVTLRLEAPTHV